jgi:hypothetical protein
LLETTIFFKNQAIMKIKSLPLLLLAILCSMTAHAQWDVVRETERMMSFGSRPCFRMEFSDTDPGVIESVWKDFAKKNFAAKLKKAKGNGPPPNSAPLLWAMNPTPSIPPSKKMATSRRSTFG